MAESPTEPSSNSPAPIAEIDLGPSKLDQFLENNQTKLLILAILIALAVVAYVIYDGLAEAQAQDAGSALLTAEKPDDYLAVINTWPDSNAAASARLLLADLQWSDSQADAIASLEEFISKYPQHPSVGTAKTSLGLRLLEQGKTAEASDVLAEVAENDAYTYIAPLACISLGDIAKEEGKTADATRWYEKAQQEQPGQANSFKEIAAQRLLLVNARPPQKIKPALPAAPQAPQTEAGFSLPKLEKPDGVAETSGQEQVEAPAPAQKAE